VTQFLGRPGEFFSKRANTRLIAAVTAVLLALAVLVAVPSPAHANAGDNVCRDKGWSPVAFGWELLPCVYQDSGGNVHAKVNARGGSTDVLIFAEIGVKRGGDPVQWYDWTRTDSSTDARDNAGLHVWPTSGGNTVAAYSSTSAGLKPDNNVQYFAKAFLSESGHPYGDVEAGPVSQGQLPPPQGTSWIVPGRPTVGILNYHVTLGPWTYHFNCTGTVLNTPGRDVVATAGHCMFNDLKRMGYKVHLWMEFALPDSFIPMQQGGTAPYGVWQVKSKYMDPRWRNGQHPDADFGAYVIQPNAQGQRIQDVVGGQQWSSSIRTNTWLNTYTVAYPGAGGANTHGWALACNAPGVRFNGDSSQLQLNCPNYVDGVSGSALTTSGVAYAIIAGYHEGGNVGEAMSYGNIFNGEFQTLMNQASNGQ
jgi:hypothetical protein